MKRILTTLFYISLIISAFCQNKDKIDLHYYECPVKIPVFLAGNFAELRLNHFHGGIDIKTMGKTGLEVYSAADGYVSRITISPTGYGRALYINHPNGTTTVYGHLESFAPQIENYIRNIQYEKETFSIDQSVPPGLFPVQKGEEIAKSGNSGSSAGPHLHFEIRRTKEEIMLNPLMFNMPVKDKIKPQIQALMIYPLSSNASINGKHIQQRFEILKTQAGYRLNSNKIINVFGEIGFGLQTFDKLDGSPNQCGIFSLKLIIDNKLIYSFKLDEIQIKDTKYANSQMDYALALSSGSRSYKTWLEPGNHLNIYSNIEKHGIFQASDEQIHEIKYEIADVYGNTSNFSFKIQSKKTVVPEVPNKGSLFKYNRNNEIKDDGIRFDVPEGALYTDVDFQYKKIPSLPSFYSPIYQLHNSSTPLHIACNLKIKASDIPENLRDKIMLAQINPTSGKVYSATGKFENGWVEGNIRTLGYYTLVADTKPPKIVLSSGIDKKNQAGTNKISFKITDDLSGINNFKGTIDGKWVLFEYDLKNNLLSYNFDKKRFNFGQEHQLILEVSDFKGNFCTYKTKFHK